MYHWYSSSPQMHMTWASKKWVLGNRGETVTYYSGDSDLMTLTRTAVGRWEAAFPALNWEPGTATSSTDILVVSKPCANNLRGIMDVIDPNVSSWHTDSTRYARYWLTGQ